MLKQQNGMTLASIMVALALSGVLAVSAMQMIANQMQAMRVMELSDKGDAIFRFYSNLLHDDTVWWCTLYDGIEGTATALNQKLRHCVFGKGNCSGTAMDLKGPDCKFLEPLVSGRARSRFKVTGDLDFDKKNFRSSSIAFIKDGSKTLRRSVTRDNSGGWWQLQLQWQHAGQRSVDLIFTQSFDINKWRNAAPGRRYTPKLNYPRQLRIRRSAAYVSGSGGGLSYGCGSKAVVSIDLYTQSRTVTCSEHPLVDLTGGAGNCANYYPFGQVLRATHPRGTAGVCTGGRVAVTPDGTYDHYYIGSDKTFRAITAIGYVYRQGLHHIRANNVDKGGLLINYNDPCVTEPDQCSHGYDSLYVPTGSVALTAPGECKTMWGWPTRTGTTVVAGGQSFSVHGQGPVGLDGRDGSGPPGNPGPDCTATAPTSTCDASVTLPPGVNCIP